MNMQTMLFFLQMIPAIFGIVREIEKLIPDQGQGEAKLNLVLDTVETVIDAAPSIAQAIDKKDVRDTVGRIVNTTVRVLNDTGVFTHDARRIDPERDAEGRA